MVKEKQKRLSKGKPYHIDTGKITTMKYALANPNRVHWVDNKKPDTRISA